MRYVKYLYVQLKRTLKLAVGVFPTAMLLFACLGVAAYLFLNSGFFAEQQMKYKIGVVGKIDDTYLGFGIYAIQTLDASRFMVDFIPMTEEEAQRDFREAKLAAYIRVPDDFLDSVIYGRNDLPITYVASEGQKGISGYLMDELAVVVSKLVTNSQSAIYAMQDIVRETEDVSQLGEWTDELNLRLIDYVLGRTKLAELEELGLSNGLLFRQYYFCAILLLFCFLFGISSAPFFLFRNGDLAKWMKTRGIGVFAQVACEYLVYFLFVYVCTALPLGVLGVLSQRFAVLRIKIDLGEQLLGLVPILLMISAMHFAIYETIRNPVANLLLQFIGVIGMGYISGYIYPASFFPDGIALVGRAFPTGVALECLTGVLTGETGSVGTAGVWIYFGIFMFLSLLARRWMMVREGK